MKILIHPYDRNHRLIALSAIEINKHHKTITLYLQTTKPKQELPNKSWYCKSTSLMGDVLNYAVVPALIENGVNVKTVHRWEDGHYFLHSPPSDADAYSHIHLSLDKKITPKLFRIIIDVIYRYQNENLLKNGDSILLLPDDFKYQEQLEKLFIKNFHSKRFNKLVFQVNCHYREQTCFFNNRNDTLKFMSNCIVPSPYYLDAFAKQTEGKLPAVAFSQNCYHSDSDNSMLLLVRFLVIAFLSVGAFELFGLICSNREKHLDNSSKNEPLTNPRMG